MELTRKYQPFLKGLQEAQTTLASTLPKRKGKQFDTSQYKGIADTTQGAAGAKAAAGLGTVTVPYGGSTKFEAFHPGVDIANEIGTPIKSFMGGEVMSVVTGKQKGEKGFGNYIVVKDRYGGLHRYSHLNNSLVSVGQQVSRGAAIGEMGATGSTYSLHGGTGSHLDYRVQSPTGQYVNPLAYVIKNIYSQTNI